MAKRTKKVSSLSTGIPKQITLSKVLSGIKYNARIRKIIIDIDNSVIQLICVKNILDENGKTVSSEEKPITLVDTGAFGEVELDEKGNEKWETFVEEKPEDLIVTKWNDQLGDVIFPPAIAYVENELGLNEIIA